MLRTIKKMITRYDAWCDSMGFKQNETRCCVPVVRFDPEPESKPIHSSEDQAGSNEKDSEPKIKG